MYLSSNSIRQSIETEKKKQFKSQYTELPTDKIVRITFKI